MKARVIATGHIVDVELSHYIGDVAWYITKSLASYSENELEFIDEPQDYWTRLEHQYAGMAMQGMLSNAELISLSQKAETYSTANITTVATIFAQALVEKYKKEADR